MVEHLLLVDHIAQPETRFGNDEPLLRILHPEGREA